MMGAEAVVERATSAHLEQLRRWLRSEVEPDGMCFKGHEDLVVEAQARGDLDVICSGEEVVAYQVQYRRNPKLIWVRADRRRRGYGRTLLRTVISQAYADDRGAVRADWVSQGGRALLEGCGFVQATIPGAPGAVPMVLSLTRQQELPAGAPRASMRFTVLSEDDPEGAAPIRVVEMNAANQAGVYVLEARFIVLEDNIPRRRDAVVRMEVDGVERFCDKLRRPEAKATGFVRDDSGSCWYIDQIIPAWDR